MLLPSIPLDLNDMLWDLKRYPLPISMDPQRELGLLHRRDAKIKEIYSRYNKMLSSHGTNT